jgi:hypothetical protein
MSLNNILLTPKLVADLFPDCLIDDQTSSSPKKSLKFLGNNQKNILIVVSGDNVAFMEEEDLNFLSSILVACKLNLADVAIVNLKNAPLNISYQELINEFKSKTILLFDVNARVIDLPFNFPYFQTQQFNQCTFLSAPSLNQILGNKALKTQLWNCLKNIFGL